MKKEKNETYETIRKIRGDWGSVNPVTKVIPDKRRAKKDKESRKEIRNYE